MKVANYTEFRTGLKEHLDCVEEENETLIIKRGKGKGTVMISLDEYNSIMEMVHLLSSKEVQRSPFTGKRKPEPLKYDLAGSCSRRINSEHRLVYRVEKDKIIILSCKYHYDQ